MRTRLQNAEVGDSRVTTFSFLSVVHVRHISVVKSLPTEFNLPPLLPNSASVPAARPTNIFLKKLSVAQSIFAFEILERSVRMPFISRAVLQST